MPACTTPFAVLCVLALGLLSACGADDGQTTAERPTEATSLSPTRTLPQPTRSAEVPDQAESKSPSPSRSFTVSTDKATPESTASSTRQPDPGAQQSTVRDSTAIASPVPSAASPSPSLSPSPVPTPEQGTADREAVSPWAWVALALLVVAMAVGTRLLVRAHQRRTWLTRLRTTTAEVEWFARELIPQLRRSGSVERVAGGWQVAGRRVAAAEDQLTVLESSAHSEQDSASARRLRDAVRSAREKLGTLSGPGTHDMWVLDLEDVQALLEAVLGPAAADRASAVPPR
jgi:hypothetical protein